MSIDMSAIAARCNICGSFDFEDFNGRRNVRCRSCYSLERHRIAFELYTRDGIIGSEREITVLHLAPEKMLAKKLIREKRIVYLMSDPRQSSYDWCPMLRLWIPDDLRIFDNEYFDAILHNHVLEHIPGSFVDHLVEFKRILKPGGVMIFSIPGPNLRVKTVEGGEYIDDPAKRLELFGQEDHYKLFGYDLVYVLKNHDGMEFSFDNLTDHERENLSISPGSNKFLIWRKISK